MIVKVIIFIWYLAGTIITKDNLHINEEIHVSHFHNFIPQEVISNKCSFKSLVPNLTIVDIFFVEYIIFKPMEHLEWWIFTLIG